MLAIAFTDLLVVWLVPVAALVVLWLAVSLVVYILVRSRLRFDFKADLLRKFEEKRALPSGHKRLSYLYVAKLLLGDNCVQATLLYRISHYLARRSRALAELVHAFSRFLTHTDISPWAEIGPGFFLYHGLGTVIGKGARIGERSLICQGVTVGGGHQAIGDDVTLWPGAKVVGHVAIGDRSEIGANAVVLNDIPADAIAFGIPARLAGRKTAPSAEPQLEPSGARQ